jgi:hypothetical protein
MIRPDCIEAFVSRHVSFVGTHSSKIDSNQNILLPQFMLSNKINFPKTLLFLRNPSESGYWGYFIENKRLLDRILLETQDKENEIDMNLEGGIGDFLEFCWNLNPYITVQEDRLV